MMLSQKKYKLRIRNKVSVVVVRYGEGEVNIWYQYPKAVMQSCDSRWRPGFHIKANAPPQHFICVYLKLSPLIWFGVVAVSSAS